MSTAPQSSWIYPEAYLLGENDRVEDIKYEYVNGQVYAMAGASREHNIIAGEFFAILRNHLRESACRAFQSDMKVGVRSRNENHFYYPDVQVSCADEQDRYVNTSPCLIVEVLSDSTARTDRSEKLMAYRQLSSLQEYVLCAQDSAYIEIYRRSNEWRPEHFYSGQIFQLESVDLAIAVDELYEFLLTG